MYDINNLNFGEKLKYYRKTSKKTLLEVGYSIGKSKATISKYESNEIIPDFITLLELCNCLNISLSELFPLGQSSINSSNMINPFNSNKLYMYYYTEGKLITSIIDIYEENNVFMCKFFNGIKDITSYKNCSYYYEGTVECSRTTAYFSLSNVSSMSNMLEKVQIVANIPWSLNITICKGLILGLTPNGLPIVKKVIISTSEIKNISKYASELQFSKDDVKKIYYTGALVIENKQYDEFFFDF